MPGASRLVAEIPPLSRASFPTPAPENFRSRPRETARRGDGLARNWRAGGLATATCHAGVAGSSPFAPFFEAPGNKDFSSRRGLRRVRWMGCGWGRERVEALKYALFAAVKRWPSRSRVTRIEERARLGLEVLKRCKELRPLPRNTSRRGRARLG
jgi:hypothetical protein